MRVLIDKGLHLDLESRPAVFRRLEEEEEEEDRHLSCGYLIFSPLCGYRYVQLL